MPHINELIDYTTAAFIVYDGRVLLVNHPRYNKWLSPGGHIELDEQPDEAMMREIAEETGLEVELLPDKPRLPFKEDGVEFLITPNYMDIHEANPPHRHTCFIYFAKAKNGDFKKSDEHDELRWFSPEELEDPQYNLSQGIRFYSQEAIKKAAS